MLDRYSKKHQLIALGIYQENISENLNLKIKGKIPLPCRTNIVSGFNIRIRHVKVGDSTRTNTPLCVWRLLLPIV